MAGNRPFSELNELISACDLLPAGCTVLCAVSGGADSIYLLHRLYHLRGILEFRLVAAHYNHQLRGTESRRDEEFVREFVARHCGGMRLVTAAGERLLPPVELAVGRGDVAGEAARLGTGLEETARAMRYSFLEETAERLGADRIATAHTADDNAETLLLHLLRGTGLQGLSGIAPRRGKLIRPMLTTTRQTVEQYLNLYGIPHVEDSSNREDTFLRNRLRHQMMPLLEELAPGFTERSRDTLDWLRRDQDYLEAQAALLYRESRWEEDTLVIPAAVIAQAPDALAVRAVRRMLAQLRDGDDSVSAAHLLAVVSLCRGDSPSGQADLPGGLTACREYGRMVLGPARPLERVKERTVTVPGILSLEGNWTLRCEYRPSPIGGGENDGFFCFDCAKLKGPLRVRGRMSGDELALPGRPRRSLKKILIDRKVPRRRRESIPILADDLGVLAAAGIGPDSRRLARDGAPALWVRFESVPGDRPPKDAERERVMEDA